MVINNTTYFSESTNQSTSASEESDWEITSNFRKRAETLPTRHNMARQGYIFYILTWGKYGRFGKFFNMEIIAGKCNANSYGN